MIATRRLPVSYQLIHQFDLQRDRSLLIRLSILSFILFFPAGGLFLALGIMLHPDIQTIEQVMTSSLSLIEQLAASLLSIALFTLLHELVHGLFFWTFTQQLPHFGLSAAYAFAAAPDWYLARNPYLWIGAAPAILLSVIGAALLPLIPVAWCFLWMLGLAMNLSGSVGDFYIIGWLSKRSDSTFIQDHGDIILVYEPA